VQRVRQREVLLEAVLLLVLRAACTTITGIALPNLMTNLKKMYAKTEPSRFLKPVNKKWKDPQY